MGRTREKKKFLHQPSTHELYSCLYAMPEMSILLFQYDASKPYSAFLEWLINVNYKNRSDTRGSIKDLAATFNSNPAKVTKWIHAIYEDIFELNNEQPQLFQKEGIPVTLYMNHYDNSCTFKLSLPAVPGLMKVYNSIL